MIGGRPVLFLFDQGGPGDLGPGAVGLGAGEPVVWGAWSVRRAGKLSFP